MPEFLPFRGLRYTGGGVLDSVTAPPYDVIDADQRSALAARDQFNAVRLILPEASESNPNPYSVAAGLLSDWSADAVLTLDDTPAFYVYRMSFTERHGKARTTTGVLGALSLPEHIGTGEVLPHERTLPKAKSDRLEILRTTRANLDPIWGLCTANGLTESLNAATKSAPLAECADEFNVHHALWALTDPTGVEAVRDTLAAGPLVLADGHHRFETALAYRSEQGSTDHGSDAILCFVVELEEKQLVVHAIHRLLSEVPTNFLDLVAKTFEVRDSGPHTAQGIATLHDSVGIEDAIGLVLPDRLFLLVPAANALDEACKSLPESLHNVASAHFETLIRPLLGEAALTYRNDAEDCAEIVANGGAAAAIILAPVSVATIRDAGQAGVRMPEKTTFFWPKPRTGMVFRVLDSAS